jgi:hypothetical protein
MRSSLNQLYKVVGISKQAAHQYQIRQIEFDKKLSDLIVEVDELRSEHPGCGVEKMYSTLEPDFIGRDKFIETFMSLGYRVKKIKNYYKTTIPVSYKYPNLIEGLVVSCENMVWQSDITYFDVNGRFYYLVFLIDVYSRKIVGYAVSDHLRAEANIKALKMALTGRSAPKIHHSDRGGQYIDNTYTNLLKENGTNISMGLIAQDNAYAERLNGIIKNEYLKYKIINSFEDLKKETKKAVEHYNNKRIHGSLPNKLNPNHFECLSENKDMIEIIYAQNRPKPKGSTSFWFDEIKKNDLICCINN